MGAFFKLTPVSGSLGLPINLTLDWSDSADADYYEYCYDTTNDGACGGWVNNGLATCCAIC